MRFQAVYPWNAIISLYLRKSNLLHQRKPAGSWREKFQLPPDLFFGTTIATCILVLKKNKADNKTLFIDATAEFVRGSAKNKLTNANAKRILDCYSGRETREYFSRLVEHAEIAENNYNISAGGYVVQKDNREIVDITELNASISQIVKRQTELRHNIDAIVAELEGETA